MIPTELSLQQLLEHINPAGTSDEWAKTICRSISQMTGSSLTALYRLPKKTQWLVLQAHIGHTAPPKHLSNRSEFFQAAAECGGAVLQNSPTGPFPELLLNEQMQSGIAVLLGNQAVVSGPFPGILIANYSAPYHFTGSTIALFEQVRTLVHYAPKSSGGKA